MMSYDKGALARLMKRRGWDHTRLAEESGITPGNVRFLRAGVTEPKASTLAKLAAALGVPITEFFKAA